MRPTKDEMFMEIAHVLARRATCQRRSVGCVIVDYDGIILSTGYNGTPKRMPHCSELNCSAGAVSGVDMDSCMALHAEQNAIARLRSPDEAWTMYCTTEPCTSCLKLLLATTIRRVVFQESYDSKRPLIAITGLEWCQI